VQAMGMGERAMGLVRFSLGWKTSEQEVRKAAEVVEQTITKMVQKEEVKE
jgi:cysteine sulfinate desulfinase/cysteine desulfurase-like protein